MQLELAVKTQQADFVDVRVADALRQVSDLELLQVGKGRRARGRGKEAPGRGGIREAVETGGRAATRAVDRGRCCVVVARGPFEARCPGLGPMLSSCSCISVGTATAFDPLPDCIVGAMAR